MAETNTRLRLMTFNVRNLHGDDGTPNSWENRRDIAVHVINAAVPDIIGMQEAYRKQIDYFLQRCPMASLGDSRYGNTEDEYSNIFYRMDKFGVRRWGEFWLSETPDVPGSCSSYEQRWPRMVTWAEFYLLDRIDTTFYYFNTHFPLSEQARKQAVTVLLERITAIVEPIGTPVFVGGDFNARQFSPVYKRICSAGFTDSWGQTGMPLTDEIDGTVNHFCHARTTEHIDWIFIKNACVESIAIDYYNENGRYPSDHFPVNVTVWI